jgi:hypothetical protein
LSFSQSEFVWQVTLEKSNFNLSIDPNLLYTKVPMDLLCDGLNKNLRISNFKILSIRCFKSLKETPKFQLSFLRFWTHGGREIDFLLKKHQIQNFRKIIDIFSQCYMVLRKTLIKDKFQINTWTLYSVFGDFFRLSKTYETFWLVSSGLRQHDLFIC